MVPVLLLLLLEVGGFAVSVLEGLMVPSLRVLCAWAKPITLASAMAAAVGTRNLDAFMLIFL